MGTVPQYWKVLHPKINPAILTCFLYCFGFTIVFFAFLLDAGAAIPVLKIGFVDIVALMFAYMLTNLISSLRYVILFKPIRRLSFRQLYLVQMIVRAHSYSLPFIAGYRKSEKIIEDRLRIPAEISRSMIGIDQLIIFVGGIIPALFICFGKGRELALSGVVIFLGLSLVIYITLLFSSIFLTTKEQFKQLAHRIALNKSSLIDKGIYGLESYTLVFTAIGRKSIDFFWLLLLSLLSHFLEFISLLLILKSFGLSCDLAVVWVISVLFHLLIQIPGPPGLIGVYELIGCFIFTRSGYLPGEAAAVTVILHLIITLRIIFGLLLVDGKIGLKSQARTHVKSETGQEFISPG